MLEKLLLNFLCTLL